ncbi:hypothetical protein ACFX15_033246 [Malus domestica]
MNLLDFKSPPLKTPLERSDIIIVDSSCNLWFNLCTLDPPLSFLATLLPRGAIVSVNYRLAPEHLYPSQYENAFDAFEFVDDHNQDFEGVDLKQCFLVGDSAGANIAHLRASEHMFESPKVIGMLSIQLFEKNKQNPTGMPVVNVERSDWMWRLFLPMGWHHDQPATTVFVGGFDPLQK